MKRRIRAWWARLFGKDEESREIAAAFRSTVAAPPVSVAVDDVIAATERACRAVRSDLRATPPPMPRLAPIPSIPEDP